MGRELHPNTIHVLFKHREAKFLLAFGSFNFPMLFLLHYYYQYYDIINPTLEKTGIKLTIVSSVLFRFTAESLPPGLMHGFMQHYSIFNVYRINLDFTCCCLFFFFSFLLQHLTGNKSTVGGDAHEGRTKAKWEIHWFGLSKENPHTIHWKMNFIKPV